ncbi:hypothetical protein [Halalkalicoccus subterraneus]|uniref:hypothetical protein n=1 Tax=Halalkalicoccus subterraneus TaxID=2675002 RepID=UPI000EFD3848|nr:hypothetical protein [Halalkalicoccus subterraneus]
MVSQPAIEDGDSDAILRDVRAVTLPPGLARLADEYNDTIGDRDPYLWKWLYEVIPLFRLSTVEARYADQLLEQKLLLAIYITLLDDLAEIHGDGETFDEARKLSRPHQEISYDRHGLDEKRLRFAETVWNGFEQRQRDAPFYGEYRALFDFDVGQTLNAIDYSLLLNDNPAMGNTRECKLYDSHNMAVYSYVDLDLMYSPGFSRADLSTLRSITWYVQYLARIGNWIATWERELVEGDYTSGVIARALETGVVDDLPVDGVSTETRNRIARRIRTAGIEEHFETEWRNTLYELQRTDCTAVSVDLPAFIDGMRRVDRYYEAGRGYL